MQNHDVFINAVRCAIGETDDILLPGSIARLQEDIVKILIELDEFEVATLNDGKKILGVQTTNRALNAFDILAFIGHITAYTGRVPVFKRTKFGSRILEWVPLDEAKKMMAEKIAEVFFTEKVEERFPKDVLKAPFEITIKKEIEGRNAEKV